MYLKKLSIRSLRGLIGGFDLGEISPGLNVIAGPNASGKTSLCTVVRRLLWDESCAKGRAFASIHSEWAEAHKAFTIGLEQGIRTVSQEGKTIVASLPESYLASCYTITIDDLFAGNDLSFAQRIAAEMAGGLNIEAVRASIEEGSNNAKSALGRWEAARGAWNSHKRELEALCQEKETMPWLEQKIQEAREAKRKGEMLHNILAAQSKREEIARTRRLLEQFPASFRSAQIASSDWSSYEKLEQDLCAVRQDIQDLEEEIGGSGFLAQRPHAPWSEGEWNLALKRIERMEQLQRDLEQNRYALHAMQVEEQSRFLGIAREEDIAHIRVELLDGLASAWEQVERGQRSVQALQAEMRLHEETEYCDEKAAEQISLTLCAMIACGDFRWLYDWAVMGSAVIAGAGLFCVLEAKFCLLALSPLLPLAVLWMRKAMDRRTWKEAKEEYSALSSEPLHAVEGAALRRVLKHSVQRWGRALQQAVQRQRKSDLAQRLSEEQKRGDEAAEALLNKAKAAGMHTLPVQRLAFFQKIHSLHESWIQLQQAKEEKRIKSEELALEWEAWNVFAARFQAGACSHVYELRTMHQKIKDNQERALRLQEKITELHKKKQRESVWRAAQEQILERTGCPGDPERLRAWVERLPAYQQTVWSLKAKEEEWKEWERLLGTQGLQRIGENKEDLEQEASREKEKGEALEALVEQKGGIVSRLQESEKASKGEALLCDQEEALRAVCDAARLFIAKECARFLINEAQKDFERTAQPPVLVQAMEWFQIFTRNQFTLEAPWTQTGSLVYEVIDTASGERKTLDQLSRGTRMQLLLAVRLSFVLCNEKQGIMLPIFLDEVLANTDSERFHAIGEVIGSLVQRGRQVFYLTCSREDLVKWDQIPVQAHRIDLAHAQRQHAFLRAPWKPLPEEAAIPKPSGQNMEDYIQQLKLARLNMDAPIEQVPIHYFVDCPETLYQLLRRGVEVYGALKHCPQKILAQCMAAAVPMMERRAALLETFFPLKNQGRGKKLSYQAIREGGLSEAFHESLWALAQEVECDTKRWIAAVEEKRIKRFRIDERWDQFKCFLSQKGFLDEREILSDDAILRTCFAETWEEADLSFFRTLLRSCLP